MRHIVLLLTLLAGCTPGPSSETLIDELRIIGAVVEPPEVAPGESTDVEVLVADPFASGALAAVWMCTPTGDGCAEAGSPVSERLFVGGLEDGFVNGVLTVNPLWAAFATDEPLPAGLWVLACEPGLCPQLDVFADADGTGSPELEELLSTPTQWVADLPLSGVSLAAKQIAVSTRPLEERNANPVLIVEGSLESAPGEELTLEVSVDDAEVAEVMGLSTAGGFGLPAFAFLDGVTSMRWYAPEEPEQVRLYAVASDGLGGTAMWTDEALVR